MSKISYRCYRFPPEIIQRAVWLYFRFTLSFRDVEDLLAERGIEVSYETIRQWVMRFGPAIARDLRSRRPRPHGQWHLDEMFVSIAKPQRLKSRMLARPTLSCIYPKPLLRLPIKDGGRFCSMKGS